MIKLGISRDMKKDESHSGQPKQVANSMLKISVSVCAVA